MPVPLTLNGVTYQYPRLGDENWGQDATNWAIGITQLVNSIDTLINNTIATGFFELADGSPTIPSLRFQNSLTTGLYRAGANTIGFSTNGTAVGSINASGLWNLNSLQVTGSSTLAGASATSLNVSGSSTLGSVSLTELSANGYVLEQLNTVTLLNNTTDNVFTYPVANNKNFIIDFSLTRNTGKETGQILMSTDGTTVQVSGNCSTVVDCGVSFSGDINSGNVRLRYTTTNTGFNATMKYVVKRWND